MDNKHERSTVEITPRQKANRLVGLSSYALGAVVIGILGFCIYDDPASAKKDFTSLTIMAAFALVCFAIGFTTNQRKQ